MEECASVKGSDREGHIAATCPGIPLLPYESFICIPMYKSSCRPVPAAVMSLAS